MATFVFGVDDAFVVTGLGGNFPSAAPNLGLRIDAGLAPSFGAFDMISPLSTDDLVIVPPLVGVTVPPLTGGIPPLGVSSAPLAADFGGTVFADILTGDAGPNRMFGNAGDDVLTGLGGSDVIQGGAGRDSFVFVSPADGVDVLGDFEPGIDKVVIDRARFWPIGLQPAAGKVTPQADGDVATVTSDGTLLVDMGGDGFGAPVALAIFPASVPGAGDILLA